MSYAKELWKALTRGNVNKGVAASSTLIEQTKLELLNGARFVLPANGVIMDDPQARGLDLKGDLHLPFDTMVLQYPVPFISGQMQSEGKVSLTKAVLVITADIGKWLPPIFNNPEWLEYFKPVAVTPWLYAETSNKWASSSSFLLPTRNWNTNDLEGGDLKVVLFKIRGTNLKELSAKELDDGYTNSAPPYGCYAIIELLNILACSNVHLTKKRTDKVSLGRPPLPFSETWELLVDARKAPTAHKGEIAGCTIIDRRSPREHIRMGHIRTYDSGLKVWINATVVAKGSAGKIKKTYRVPKNT